MESRIRKLEELTADLIRTVEDLSDVTARQAAEIDRLERRVALLMARAAEAEAESGGTEVLTDRRPPHW